MVVRIAWIAEDTLLVHVVQEQLQRSKCRNTVKQEIENNLFFCFFDVWKLFFWPWR